MDAGREKKRKSPSILMSYAAFRIALRSEAETVMGKKSPRVHGFCRLSDGKAESVSCVMRIQGPTECNEQK
jgi:hypothetical protein